MKYVINFFTTLLVVWPFVAVGYLLEAAATGVHAGRIFFSTHSTDTLAKIRKEKTQ